MTLRLIKILLTLMLAGLAIAYATQNVVNIEQAFQRVVEKYTATLAAIDDEYLRERVSDMRDISSRVLDNLLGRKGGGLLDAVNEPCIIVCHELPPSMASACFNDGRKVISFVAPHRTHDTLPSVSPMAIRASL